VKWIVEMPIVWIFPSGERVSGQIAIGEPVPDDDGDALCPITMGGLDGPGRVTPINGSGTFHALLLGIGFIAQRIRDSVAQGVRVELPGFGDLDDPTAMLLEILKPFGRSADPEPLPRISQ
jgi:hypothetical protein